MITLRSLTPRLLAGFGFAALLTGAGLFASSRPAHTAGGPIAVTVANSSLAVSDADAARQAVSNTLILSGPVFSAPNGTLYTVPANKRLVIETVSLVGNRNDANRYTFEMDTKLNGVLNQTFFDLIPNGALYAAQSQAVRLYADPGSSIVVISQNTGNNVPFAGFSFSGHLVDL